MKFKIVFVIMLFSTQLYAQKIVPGASTPIDKETLKRNQRIVQSIKTMLLTCDTVFFEKNHIDDSTIVISRFKTVHFDQQNRMRKYFFKESNEGGNCAMHAYYDNNGKLIYITYKRSGNCEDSSEAYYINNAYILDFLCNLNCGCCEGGKYSREEINRMRPIVGHKLVNMARWDADFTHFIYADTLLNVLKSKGYQGYEEFESRQY